MTKEIWLNLPVKDISRSKEFFTKLGFSFNEKNGNGEDMACLLVGSKNFPVMLFKDSVFNNFTKVENADLKGCAEVLISIDAESREEVDEMARKASDAGGTIFEKPEEIQGWMYGCGFADPDGHRWNVLYMDMSKKQK